MPRFQALHRDIRQPSEIIGTSMFGSRRNIFGNVDCLEVGYFCGNLDNKEKKKSHIRLWNSWQVYTCSTQ